MGDRQGTITMSDKEAPSSGLFNIDSVVLCAAILICSFIEFWAAIALCVKKHDGQLGGYNDKCEKEWAWAVCAGLFGVLMSLACLILNKCKPDMLKGIVGWVLYFGLFAVWFCAVFVCTMDKPFAPGGGTGSYGDAGNGYFAIWLSLIFSTLLFFQHVPAVAMVMQKLFGTLNDTKKMLLAIFGCSVLEMWHAAVLCDEGKDCAKMLAWAVSAGAISAILILIFTLCLHFVPAVSNFTKFLAGFLTVWWLAAMCTITMPNGNSSSDCDSDDPYCVGVFMSASNGFFGTWMALLLCIVLTCQEFGLDLPGFKAQETGPSGAKSVTGTATTITTTISRTTGDTTEGTTDEHSLAPDPAAGQMGKV